MNEQAVLNYLASSPNTQASLASIASALGLDLADVGATVSALIDQGRVTYSEAAGQMVTLVAALADPATSDFVAPENVGGSPELEGFINALSDAMDEQGGPSETTLNQFLDAILSAGHRSVALVDGIYVSNQLVALAAAKSKLASDPRVTPAAKLRLSNAAAVMGAIVAVLSPRESAGATS